MGKSFFDKHSHRISRAAFGEIRAEQTFVVGPATVLRNGSWADLKRGADATIEGQSDTAAGDHGSARRDRLFIGPGPRSFSDHEPVHQGISEAASASLPVDACSAELFNQFRETTGRTIRRVGETEIFEDLQ